MPTLRELEGSFLSYRSNGSLKLLDAIAAADGVMFLCPKCWLANHGPVNTHAVICWFEGRVPDSVQPAPGRWTPRGTSLDDLTFVPSAARPLKSVQLNGGCNWHGFV